MTADLILKIFINYIVTGTLIYTDKKGAGRSKRP